MAVPFSNTKLRVPKGFQNILECLAREVLRSQPDNIHEFAAAYFEKMLKVRAETGHDPALHGARLEDRNYNNESFKKRSVDPSDPQQQQAAVTIQTQFRQHSAKGEVQAMREEDAATRIQAGFRGYIDREQVRNMKDDDVVGGGDKAEEEVDIDLNDPDVEKAAIKIQAGFKGFKARKDVQGKEEEPTTTAPAETEEKAEEEPAPEPAPTEAPVEQQAAQGEEEVDIDLEDPATEKAALKIQAGFRGYQTRRDMSSKPQGGTEQQEQGQQEGEQTQAEEEAAQEKPAEEEQTTTDAAPDAGEEKKQEVGEEEVDIDLEDPEVEKAAMKIQAGFKGFKARKELQEKKPEGDTVDGAPAEGQEAAAEPKVEDVQEEIKATEEETQPKQVADEGQGQEEQKPAEEAEGDAQAVEEKGAE